MTESNPAISPIIGVPPRLEQERGAEGRMHDQRGVEVGNPFSESELAE